MGILREHNLAGKGLPKRHSVHQRRNYLKKSPTKTTHTHTHQEHSDIPDLPPACCPPGCAGAGTNKAAHTGSSLLALTHLLPNLHGLMNCNYISMDEKVKRPLKRKPECCLLPQHAPAAGRRRGATPDSSSCGERSLARAASASAGTAARVSSSTCYEPLVAKGFGSQLYHDHYDHRPHTNGKSKYRARCWNNW